MIDNQDKQTQALPLEQKRGRGRPATGQALSNAERQRRYREAQKAQRNEKPKGVAWEDARALMTKIDELTADLKKALERAEMAEAQSAQRNEKTEKVKRHRDDPPVDLRQWAIQRQSPKGQWRTVAKYDTASEANIELADQAGAMGHLYRVKALK